MSRESTYNTRVLLEAGTNELELLEFKLNETSYAVNVAKVREILQRPEITHVPESPPAVEGLCMLRGESITILNLGVCLNTPSPKVDAGGGLLVVVEFNKRRHGILVDAVETIRRFNWGDILPPPEAIARTEAPITAMVCMEDKVMSVPDFEFIVADLLGLPNNDVPLEAESEERAHEEYRLLIVDDSAVIRHNIKRLLRDAGYKHITVCTDGQHAWETVLAEANKVEEPGTDPYDLILTDIEMPRMDGLHLCKRLKDHPQLTHMPVVIFSSLVNEGNMNKGAAVGADCQVTKFEGCQVLTAITECLVRHDKLRKHRKFIAKQRA